MDQTPLYPLRFAPIYQYRPWGGRRLADLLSAPLPGDDLVGEAWLLSDRDDHTSLVAEGSLKGSTIRQLLMQWPVQMLGKLAPHYTRFPLLLKFLDVTQKLSVQVHPSDAFKELIPAGDTGKTEAWVVLEKGAEARIYAGLNPDVTADVLRQAITNGTVAKQLASFEPKLGDNVFLRAGTVHSASDVVVFEVQENSDVTFRLDDWDHVDPKTGERRPLQIEQAMTCINFTQGAIGPGKPQREETEPVRQGKARSLRSFRIWRISGDAPFTVGAPETPRVLVCIVGKGEVKNAGARYAFSQGEVILLPAAVGACSCHPDGFMTILDISLPDIR